MFGLGPGELLGNLLHIPGQLRLLAAHKVGQVLLLLLDVLGHRLHNRRAHIQIQIRAGTVPKKAHALWEKCSASPAHSMAMVPGQSWL